MIGDHQPEPVTEAVADKKEKVEEVKKAEAKKEEL